MNRSGIEWCDHTWNPITGCRHDCGYCYARRMTARFSGDVRLNKMAKTDYRVEDSADGTGIVYYLEDPMLNETGSPLVYPFGFEPTYHHYRRDTLDKFKMGNNIFVGAMADVFGAWVPDRWIDEIIAECVRRPIHNYLFLTKNPERYTQIRVPVGMDNMWYGTSITGKADMARVDHLPASCNTFVNIEPLLEDIAALDDVMFRQIKWVIIGAETGNRKGKVIPDPDWIHDIVTEADRNDVPVFMKDSLIPIVGKDNLRKGFPKQLQKTERMSPKMQARLLGVCVKCKIRSKKGEMITLFAKQRRVKYPEQIGFMCKGCFAGFCGEMGIDMPFEEAQKGVDPENEDR